MHARLVGYGGRITTPENRVQFGLIVPENPLNPPNRHHYLDDVTRLLSVVKRHYDSARCIDHLDGDVLEGWTALTYLAACHPDLVWGHTVLCQAFQNPALVAKTSATLQSLLGGQFVLGFGAGGQAAEYLAYGYPLPPSSTRVAEHDEALQIITTMWTEERASFAGRYYRVQDASCEPKPDPRPPIMIGAFRPRMLRLTARHADWRNVSSTGITVYRGYLDEFERACNEIGRDPATVRRTWSGGCVCAPSDAEVRDLAAGRLPMRADIAYQVGEDFVGTPAQIVEQMQPFIAAGVDYFMLDCGGFPKLTTVGMLIAEVLPVLNQ